MRISAIAPPIAMLFAIFAPSMAQAAPCQGGDTECDYNDVDQPDPNIKTSEGETDPADIEGILIFDPPPAPAVANDGAEFTVLSIRGWPETKTEIEMKCKRVVVRICTKWPQIYKRTSHMQWIAQVSHPKWPKVQGSVTQCNKEAISAGVVAGVLAENIPAALAAYQAYMKVCLASVLKKHGRGIKFGMYKKKTPGPWSKI